jgi:hypothetical protein
MAYTKLKRGKSDIELLNTANNNLVTTESKLDSLDTQIGDIDTLLDEINGTGLVDGRTKIMAQSLNYTGHDYVTFTFKVTAGADRIQGGDYFELCTRRLFTRTNGKIYCKGHKLRSAFAKEITDGMASFVQKYGYCTIYIPLTTKRLENTDTTLSTDARYYIRIVRRIENDMGQMERHLISNVEPIVFTRSEEHVINLK